MKMKEQETNPSAIFIFISQSLTDRLQIQASEWECSDLGTHLPTRQCKYPETKNSRYIARCLWSCRRLHCSWGSQLQLLELLRSQRLARIRCRDLRRRRRPPLWLFLRMVWGCRRWSDLLRSFLYRKYSTPLLLIKTKVIFTGYNNSVYNELRFWVFCRGMYNCINKFKTLIFKSNLL